jgi:HEAT repeat protein
MSSSPTADQPKRKADDALPRVEPPGAGFLLQLFLIPLLIVVIIVVVWLMFTWLAHLGSDPRALVGDIAKGDKYGWQRAAALADMLRNREYEHLKTDKALARELAKVLQKNIEQTDKDFADDEALASRLRLRMFLCRALGEFRVDDGLPALLLAAKTQRREEELLVRRRAIEAIAVLAQNLGPERLRQRADVVEVLIQASRERPESGADEHHAYADLRSTAAYALGAIGGEPALDRLASILSDAYPNARYNAATGLARHGDERATAVLLEMLAPTNDAALQTEESESEKTGKLLLIQKNGMTAVELLHEANPTADFSALKAALQTLAAHANTPATVRQRAAAVAKSLGP